MQLPPDLERRLADLEAQLPALIEANPEPGEFWMAFAGEADAIEDQAGECHALPNPRSLMAADLVWFQAKRGYHGANNGMFLRLSENPPHTKTTLRGGEIHSLRDIAEDVQANYSGHHQFAWARPHEAWLAATCPVYIDFGEPFMARLQAYDESGLRCVRMVSREEFIEATMTATRAVDLFPD